MHTKKDNFQDQRKRKELVNSTNSVRAVASGGAGGRGLSPPVFGRSVNPISTRGGTLSPPSTKSLPPGFSELATALSVEQASKATKYGAKSP